MQKIQNFYKDIKNIRLTKMITQNEMAKILGTTQVSYCKLERGIIHKVELATLFRIARILNLDLNKYANEINILDDLKSIDESKKQKLVNNQKAIL